MKLTAIAVTAENIEYQQETNAKSSFACFSANHQEPASVVGDPVGYLQRMESRLGPDRLISATPLINANATDPFKFVKGSVVALDADVPLCPSLLNGEFLTVTVTCPIQRTSINHLQELTPAERSLYEAQITDAYYADQRDALLSAVKQVSPLPPSLRSADDSGVFLTKDDSHWEPALGAQGIAGVYKSVAEGERPLGSAPDYFIAVTASVDSVAADYYEHWRVFLATNPTVTGRQLMEHPSTHRLHDLTIRNACIAAYAVAEALGVKIIHKWDSASVHAQNNPHDNTQLFGPPCAAEPGHLRIANGCALVTDPQSHAHENIVFYHGASLPANTCTGHNSTAAKGGVAVDMSLRDGLALFEDSRVACIRAPLWGGYATCGRTALKRPTNNTEQRQDAAVFCWEGSERVNARLASIRATPIRSVAEELGEAQRTAQLLSPVICKISNPAAYS